tara:strand:+ start:58 stop:450 length:393 start_codon:yes stop_codon:yes gene_type:complete
MDAKIKLCELKQLEDGCSDGFVVNTAEGRCGIIVIRQGDSAVSYINSCPHVGTPLEIQHGRFLDQTGEYILCSTHGALFKIKDGLCVAGPCINDRLKPVDLELRGGVLYVDPKHLPALWPPFVKANSPNL